MSNRPDLPDEPHARDVHERAMVDDGFAAGWGLHMKPSVRYWIDCHTHMLEHTPQAVQQATTDWHEFMWGHRLRRHVAIDGYVQNMDAFAAVAQKDDRLIWFSRMDPTEPDPEHLRRCHELGAVGLKLHNRKLISQRMDHRLVLSDAWHEVYALAGKLGVPILWHVTQRLTDAPYTGGGRRSYWKEGDGKGVEFTNEDLLMDFLEVVAAHRDTTFIGAHQLHLGPERMTLLFKEHPNLVIDTSIGCFVAYGDTMYASDQKRWRDFVMANADRILFGSDVMIDRQSVNTELLRQHFLGHVRWVKQLNLPQDVLSKVAHENFERLTGLEPVEPLPWGALRP